MKLTKNQRDKLWGETGPYSQVNLIIETRILDDSVSRIFLLVEVNINPFTFETISKNRKIFKDDVVMQELLDHAEFRGQSFGYVSCTFIKEYRNESVMEEAKMHVNYSKATIIKMHKFIIDLINKERRN